MGGPQDVQMFQSHQGFFFQHLLDKVAREAPPDLPPHELHALAQDIFESLMQRFGPELQEHLFYMVRNHSRTYIAHFRRSVKGTRDKKFGLKEVGDSAAYTHRIRLAWTQMIKSFLLGLPIDATCTEHRRQQAALSVTDDVGRGAELRAEVRRLRILVAAREQPEKIASLVDLIAVATHNGRPAHDPHDPAIVHYLNTVLLPYAISVIEELSGFHFDILDFVRSNGCVSVALSRHKLLSLPAEDQERVLFALENIRFDKLLDERARMAGFTVEPFAGWSC